MAGGSGKYNQRVVAELAAAAERDADAAPVLTSREIVRADDLGDALASVPAGSGLSPSRRHCWVLGAPEDPGPHPALLIGRWVRRGGEWFVKVTWYSEAEDAVVQQWLPAGALRPVR